MKFVKASKTQARLRLALAGTSGAGKSYSALSIAQHLGSRVAVIDTERGSASKYAGIFNFDVLNLDTFSPRTYVEAIHAAEEAGYDVIIIDSLTHAWSGKDGALEQVNNATKRQQGGNSYTAWRDVTPQHNALVDAILGCKAHVIATMRAKTEYVLEENERGKKVPRKIGMAPIQREGMEYEFDVFADMRVEGNEMVVTKSRCPAMTGGVFSQPGKEVADILKAWLTDGAPAPVKETKKEEPRDEADFDSFKFALESAATLEELAKIRADIVAAYPDKCSERDALSKMFSSRQSQLKGVTVNA